MHFHCTTDVLKDALVLSPKALNFSVFYLVRCMQYFGHPLHMKADGTFFPVDDLIPHTWVLQVHGIPVLFKLVVNFWL